MIKNTSFWDYKAQEYPQLDGDIKVDAAIIGGGLAGLTCAYFAARAGLSVCVLEADRVGRGETLKSSAMVTFAHDLIYSRLIPMHGIETAKRYFSLNSAAVGEIAGIVNREKIECGLKQADMVLFSTTKGGLKKIMKEYRALLDVGAECELISESELPYRIRSGVRIRKQYHLDPYKYAHGLAAAVTAAGGKVYEQTPVTDPPVGNILMAGGHKVTADSFIVATHFPYIKLPGIYFLKMYQHRSHNVVFKSGLHLADMYESAEDDGYEYRPAGDSATLCGGGNVRTGDYEKGGNYYKIERHINSFFLSQSANKEINRLNSEGKEEAGGVEGGGIIARFSAQDCITYDLLPYAGAYSDSLKNVYAVTGFNKWGFTNSVAAAKTVVGLITQKPYTDKNIFDTKRHYYIKATLEFAKNAADIAGNFINLLFNADAKKLRNLQNGQGAVVTVSGKRLGIYKDENGKLQAVSAVCPHLGCGLKWNQDETSWDCPCHGSRFDIQGNILTNPALKKAEKVNLNDM